MYFSTFIDIYIERNIMKNTRKTITLSETTHKLLLVYCKKKSLKLSDWIDKLVYNTISKIKENE
jgi:hypothetical protein